MESTKIRVELAKELSTNKSKKGEEVICRVKEDVLGPNKEVLIRKGARATGVVVEAKGAGWLGKKGKLSFSIDTVEAVDGTKISLRSEQKSGGKGRTGVVAAAALLIFLPLAFIKGKNATVPVGAGFDAYIDQTTPIDVTADTLGGVAGGVVPGGAAQGGLQMATPGSKSYVIQLHDGTTVEGVISGLADGRLMVQTDATTVKMIPWDTINSFAVKSGPGTAQALTINLKSGTQVVGFLESFKDGKFNINTAQGSSFIEAPNLVSMSVMRSELK